MNSKKGALRSMLCCVSLTLLASPVVASDLSKSGSPAVSTNHNIISTQAQTLTGFAKKMQALAGKDFKKFRSVPSTKIIPGQYIVEYKPEYVTQMASIMAGGNMGAFSVEAQAEFRAQAVNEMTNNMAASNGMKVMNTYGHALGGFAAKMSDRALAKLLRDQRVLAVEPNQVMSIGAVQNNPTWGLDRVDEADLPLDNAYQFFFDGSGVDAYVIDTGIRATHTNFGGRVTGGFTAINDGRGTTDCNGHGTHVAGTVGSQTYGVAKNVNLIPVRVLGCNGSGSNAGVIDGVNYVARVASGPSVANMSLGGGNSTALDRAVEAAISRGVTFVVAAGNSNADACSGSPNRVGPALTVGATTRTDQRSSFSNFGRCVDIFAPGSQITSTWSTSNTATNTISGTSMAAPHVAGVVALYLDENPSASPALVESVLEGAAVRGRLSNIRTGSPNLLLQSLLGGGGDGGDGGDGGGGGACAFEDNFTTSTGWTIAAASNCATGTYVRSNPTQVTNSGVVTQVGGDAGGDGFAVFTAANTSAGADDVDGGVCIAQSPTVNVTEASTLSLDWFHGQRDSNDDPNGDFFTIEYSLNGGSTFRDLVSIGDVRTQAQWRNATASIPAGSNVQIRISTSDGSAAGDLVEGGIDTVSICPQ